MSFTLPVNALSSMQVSLKVELPNGKVAYSMAPSPIVAASAPSIGSKNGMQLHIVATNEESGVLLSLFVSGATGDQLAQEPLPGSAPLDMTLAAVPKPTDPLFYGGFPVTEHVGLDSNFDETMRVDPLALLGCFENTSANCNTSDFVFDALNPAYNINSFDFYDFGTDKADGAEYTMSSSHRGWSDDDSLSFPATTAPLILPETSSEDSTDDSPGDSSTEPSPVAAQDTPVTSPTPTASSTMSNWSSRRGSLAQRSSSPGTRAGLPCLDPRCDRYLATKYLLAQHMKTHKPRSDKSFRCTMGCALEFSRKHDRLRHEVAQHKKVCEWECKACFRCFSSRTTLQKHKCRARARV
ncbi:hypothetical protein DFH06DRAFT_1137943 [Mycena polygramma]|nr:hypothetical protein DFH06DRAFT_1137943 [Mycena polygramma]